MVVNPEHPETIEVTGPTGPEEAAYDVSGGFESQDSRGQDSGARAPTSQKNGTRCFHSFRLYWVDLPFPVTVENDG